MAKVKTSFFCQSCGAQSAKWVGKCPACGEWNTYVEEVLETTKTTTKPWEESSSKRSATRQAVALEQIKAGSVSRIQSDDKEFNRVLGGGIVPGSLILLGGEPGIGKSTLLLQLAVSLPELKVAYVSGEESEQQIKLRADRLGGDANNCFVITETSTQSIFQLLKQLKPDLVIVDSIQTLHTAFIDATPGSVSQIRQCAGEMQRYAKESEIPVFLVGHITKDGNIAGPKILEHIVDTVLQFEGDQHYAYRILRTIKNRFGSTAALGIYEMQNNGLRQVNNPSEILISQREEPLSGITIAATIEGLRPMLIETQALVSPAVYGTPQRSATGFDLRRLSMLLAVLEKRCGFQFGIKDVFLNLAGGIKVEDPAIDLAVVCALLSSFEDVALSPRICFAGEVGLSGEIRAVNRIEQRIAEADKLGFEQVFISKYNKGLETGRFRATITPVSKVEEVYQLLF